jgi:hypothetical protein
MMLRSIVLIFMCLFLVGCVQQKQEFSTEEYLQKSKPIAMEFSNALKAELQKAISTGDFASAIEVCKKVSHEKEIEFTNTHPDVESLRRISLKTRNAETHTPKPNEKEWLIEMENLMKRGEDPKPGLLVIDEHPAVLFPIVLDNPVCLVCHGAEEFMVPELKQALQKHYPNDQAIGYQQGDLRGALVIYWK